MKKSLLCASAFLSLAISSTAYTAQSNVLVVCSFSPQSTTGYMQKASGKIITYRDCAEALNAAYSAFGPGNIAIPSPGQATGGNLIVYKFEQGKYSSSESKE